MFRSLVEMAWGFASLFFDAVSRLSASDHDYPKDSFCEDL